LGAAHGNQKLAFSYGNLEALIERIKAIDFGSSSNPIEEYRSWRSYSGYHAEESWGDRFARNVNNSHVEEMLDFGGGGYNMFGGYGRISRLSTLAGFGDDAAIIENSANLIPKKGWYDAVVHGTEDGMAFTINKKPVSPQELYNHMLANGYQPGTKIRLMSCYSGNFPNGAAAQLQKIAGVQVAAPTGELSIMNKGSFMVNYGQQFYIAPTQQHEIGKMLLFK
jgi:hypothetical protein